MPGLNLGAGVRVRASAIPAMGGSSNYAPATPAAASTPTAQTIAQRAYGISGDGVPVGSNIPGRACIIIGAVSIGLLIWIWTTLPE